jgi:hypothetical protein
MLSNALKLVGKCVDDSIRSECRDMLTKTAVYKFQTQDAEKKIFTSLMKKERKDETETFYPDKPTLFKQLPKILQNSRGPPTPSYTAILSDIPIKHDKSRSYLEDDVRLPLRLL